VLNEVIKNKYCNAASQFFISFLSVLFTLLILTGVILVKQEYLTFITISFVLSIISGVFSVVVPNSDIKKTIFGSLIFSVTVWYLLLSTF